jgi:hypothetical protein
MTDENISIENTAAPQAEPAVQQSNVVDTVVKSEPTTFNQDQVNIISADTKRRTEERVRAEVKAEYESRYGAKPNLSTQNEAIGTGAVQSSPSTNQIENKGFNEEQLYQNFRQRQEQEQQHFQQQQMTNDSLMKIQASGKADKIESSGIGNLPTNHPLIPMLNSLDNIADVLDDFSDNPVKVANLLAVTYLNPLNGFKELQGISNSIKRNKDALAKEKAPVPSSQLKPSSLGLGGGELSMSSKRSNKAFRF